MVPIFERIERFHVNPKASQQELADFMGTQLESARKVVRSVGGSTTAALKYVDNRVVQITNAWDLHLASEERLPSVVESFLELNALAKTARALHYDSALIDAGTLAQADNKASDTSSDLQKTWATIILTDGALPNHMREEHIVPPNLRGKVTLLPTYDQIMHQLLHGLGPYLRSKDDDRAFLAELRELHIL